jgi:hypothetical protein
MSKINAARSVFGVCVQELVSPYLEVYCTGLFKKKYTLSEIYFTKTTDAKSMSCVRMERKSLKVLISMIWSGASLRLWLLLPVTCCDESGKSWIIDVTLPLHTWGWRRVPVRCENKFHSSHFRHVAICSIELVKQIFESVYFFFNNSVFLASGNQKLFLRK